jgi:hypothetical protein
MQDQNQQKIQELSNQLIQVQSRSYELISNITAERDEARQSITRLDSILKAITQSVQMEAPTVDALLAEIARLKALSVPKENPAARLKKAPTGKKS